jgi:hypothetical protein
VVNPPGIGPLFAETGFRAFSRASTNSSSGPVTITPMRGTTELTIAPMLSTTGMCSSLNADFICIASKRPSMSNPYDQMLIWRSLYGATVSRSASTSSADRCLSAILFCNSMIVAFCDSFDLWWKINSPAIPPMTSIGPIACVNDRINPARSYHGFLKCPIAGSRYSIARPRITIPAQISARISVVSEGGMLDFYMAQWKKQLERERITMIAFLSALGMGAAIVIGYAVFCWLTGR